MPLPRPDTSLGTPGVGSIDLSERRTVAWARAARAYLPRGTALPADVWARRHRGILVLLWAHAAGLTIFALVRGYGFVHSLQEGSVVALFAAVATVPWRHRTLRAALGTAGLFSASAVMVHVSGGTIEAHFHFFIMVSVIALYQDWTPFLLAIGFVLFHHGVLGVLDPSSVYNHRAALVGPWKWAAIHAAFIAGMSAICLYSWRMNEEANAAAEESYRKLYEGEHALVERLEEAQRIKDDLVQMISHEFRTPVTAILGLGQTLMDKGEQMTEEQRREFVERAVSQATRLRRIVENLLEASRVVEPDVAASADLGIVIESVIAELGDPERDRARLHIETEPGTWVAMPAEALHMVLANLLDNALKFAPEHTPIRVGASNGDGRVAFTVRNETRRIDAHDLDRIFEPFTQLDSSRTREAEGVGLGLHIVRRLVEGYGGTAGVESTGEGVTFTVTLPASSASGASAAPPVSEPAG